MHSRRDFLRIATAAILPSFFLPATMASDFWSRPRVLHLRRMATGEECSVCYFADGRLILPAYQKINHLMRDVKADQPTDIHPILLDIMCGMQGWFRSYGQERVINVNSGYRTVATNAATEGAARNSFHTRGEAADIWFDGVPVEYTAKVAGYLRGGGVGIYLRKNFCHVDKGNIRVWHG